MFANSEEPCPGVRPWPLSRWIWWVWPSDAFQIHYWLWLRLWVVSPGHCWLWLPRIYHGEVTQSDSNHERSTAGWGTADTFMAYDASSNHSERCTYLDLPERVAGEWHWLILGLILSKQSQYRVSLCWDLQDKFWKRVYILLIGSNFCKFTGVCYALQKFECAFITGGITATASVCEATECGSMGRSA